MLFRFLTILVLSAFVSAPAHAEKTDTQSPSQKVQFDYTQSGTTYQLARIALRDKLFDLEEKINRPIIVFTAREDLNGDRVPEVIVKLADKRFFCTDTEGCDTYILAVSEDGPVKIGEMKADKVFIKSEKHNNTSIIQSEVNNKKTTYVFENGAFTQQSDTKKEKETNL